MDDKNRFLDVLMNEDDESIKKYLLNNGKKPKPISPFIFSKRENDFDNESKSLDIWNF